MTEITSFDARLAIQSARSTACSAPRCETSAWRVTMSPGAPGVPHSLDKEEIFVAFAGRAVATLDGDTLDIRAGDTLVVPSGCMFALANPGPDAFEAVAIAPVGVRARLGDESFSPPWTV